jgi:hypothetical protein
MKKYVPILIIGLMLSLCFNVNSTSSSTIRTTSTENILYVGSSGPGNYSSIFDSISDDWYYLPSYTNYAPAGLPDFDQRQQRDWGLNENHYNYTFCGPVSLANVLWWFDSKNSDPDGFPGDGNDSYPLISKYTDLEKPIPGPYNDDHGFDNVNDVNTSWKKTKNSGEFIEKLAWYCDTTWFKIPLFKMAGTDPIQMKLGFKKWLRDAGLKNHYKFNLYTRPSFSFICDHVQNNDGVILEIAFYTPSQVRLKSFTFGHYVAVAGIKRDGGISISDPFRDKDFPLPEGKDYSYHNNASIVSHDHYNILYDSPSWWFFSDWWIPDYPEAGALIRSAIVISQVK